MADSLRSRDNTVIEPFDPEKDFLVADVMTHFIVVFEDRINELMWDIYKNEKTKTNKRRFSSDKPEQVSKTVKKHAGKSF